MSRVFLSYNNIIAALGFDSPAVVRAVKAGKSGIQPVSDPGLLPFPFFAAPVSDRQLHSEFSDIGNPEKYTRLEQMLLLSLKSVLDQARIIPDQRTGLIISTTKGNIDLLETHPIIPEKRVYLSELGRTIRDFFGFKTEPLVVSNACVSGILAVSVAKRLIAGGKFDRVFITSGDILSRFTVSGFDSFQAMAGEICRPYDKNRTGINLGEAAASVLVTKNTGELSQESVVVLGDGTCNDANHISGPSRTGEGLFRSIRSALQEAELEPQAIDYISAHGTATVYNDEMEAIAINRLGMESVPLNSLKGYFGHTLGASGMLETIVGMHAVRSNILIASKGYKEHGVSKPLEVIEENKQQNLNVFLKTASGFGGCNTAVIFKKYND